MPNPYEWHEKALGAQNGERIPVHDGDPQCGWFVRPVGENKVMVPASIALDSEGNLRCEVGGDEVDPNAEWLTLASRPISREEYNVLTRLAIIGSYTGPTRPRNKWTDERYIARDFLAYELMEQSDAE